MTNNQSELDESNYIDFLDYSGLHKPGEDDLSIKYLHHLDKGPKSINYMSNILGYSIEYIKNRIEPSLIKNNKIKITSKGREKID